MIYAMNFTLLPCTQAEIPLVRLQLISRGAQHMSTSEAISLPAQGGGGSRQFRGRGRGRRGGRGHRQSHSERSAASPQNSASPKSPLTHFLSLPLGHHADLRERMSAFTKSLLDTAPVIPGLDESVVIPARRLHITLGVMSLLDTSKSEPKSSSTITSHQPSCPQVDIAGSASPPTVESAVILLNSLRPKIMEMLGDNQLRVGLKCVDIMRPHRGDLEKAHVMWAGPSHEGEDVQRLKRVCEYIHKEFKEAGLVIDDKRPLKLHCAVLNTTYRRPRGRRQPFSYASVLSSSAFRAIEEVEEAIATTASDMTVIPPPRPPRGKNPIKVNLGDWVADEVQICKMGSWGPEGEYISVASIPLSQKIIPPDTDISY